MSRRVWISTVESPELFAVAGALSPDWQLVGEVDTSAERDLWRAVQRGGSRSVDFYLDADPANPWVADLVARYPGVGRGIGVGEADDDFWVAIDVYGDQTRYVVSRRRAKLAALTLRPREAHPGLLAKTVPVGMRIPATSQGLFKVCDRD